MMTFLIGLVVGYGVSVFATSNIVLPLFWSRPKVRTLERQGRLLRPIPAGLFLVAPFVWSLLVLGSVVVVNAVFPSLSGGYWIGLLGGFGQTMRLVSTPNADMESDFENTFGSYLKNRSDVDVTNAFPPVPRDITGAFLSNPHPKTSGRPVNSR